MSFTLQQTTGAAGTSPSHSQAASLPIVAAGHALIVIGNAVAAATIADSLGHTWQTAVVDGRISIWYTTVATGGPIVVTVTSSQSALISVSLQEWSFSGTLAVVDTATGSGTSTAPATGNLILSTTSLVVAGFDVVASGLTYTPGTGFTAGYTVNSGLSEPFATEYNAAQSTTPVAPGFALSSSSAWIGAAAAFHEVNAATIARTEAHDTLAAAAILATAGTIARTEARDTLAAASNTINAVTFTATGGSDSLAGVAAFRSAATLARADGPDVPSIAGNSPRTGTLAASSGPDVLAAAGWCIVATIARTEAGDALAGSGSGDSAAIVAATEAGDTLSGGSSTVHAGGFAPTGGADSLAALGDARVHGAVGATGGADTLAAVGRQGPVGTFVPTEAGDSLAAVAEFATSGVLDVTNPADDTLARGSELQYHVYSNAGDGGAIDYDTPIAATGLLTWTSDVLACDADWRFGVRCFDTVTGLEEENLDCAVRIILDAACADVTNRPAAPSGLRAFAVAGGSVKVEWHFPLTTGPRKPTGFHVYISAGTVLSYTTPAATTAYASGFANAFQAVLTGLVDGTGYVVGVRAYNASGEEPNVNVVTVTADSTGPSPVVGLTATAIV